jgi:hypothetical protein
VPPDSATRSYRALIKRGAGPSGGTLLHLIRDDAEASLCGIPRTVLTSGGVFDELVCPDCIEWLPRRMDFSRQHRRVDKPT